METVFKGGHSYPHLKSQHSGGHQVEQDKRKFETHQSRNPETLCLIKKKIVAGHGSTLLIPALGRQR